MKGFVDYIIESPEDKQPASPDEASMAKKQAEFIMYVGKEIMSHIDGNGEFPEWMQNKLSALHQKAKDMHATLGDHGDDVDEGYSPDLDPDVQKKKRISASDKDKLAAIAKMMAREKQKRKK